MIFTVIAPKKTKLPFVSPSRNVLYEMLRIYYYIITSIYQSSPRYTGFFPKSSHSLILKRQR